MDDARSLERSPARSSFEGRRPLSARISRLGLVTAVGHDAVTACAAVRAGIVRRTPLEGVSALDEDDDEMEVEVFGAPVTPLTDGFVQTGRWVRMALRAMEDVLDGAPEVTEPLPFWRDTALLWALPPITFERFGWEPEDDPDALGNACTDLLQQLLEAELAPSRDPFILEGHVGVAKAVERGMKMVRERTARRVAILATDSWLDTMSLQGLAREARLRSPEAPTGLTPSEAAAVVVLEAGDAPEGAGPPVRILSVAHQPAPGPIDAEEPAAWRTANAPQIGRALATAIDSVLPRGRPFRGDAILDLNGEEWRAHVWGHALVHLSKRLDAREVVPATSYGDIGAASAAAALCLASRAYARGYASAEETLVCSLSDDGQVAAMLVGGG